MKEWIISVACVCILTTLLELFIADGETKKYIRGILSVVIVFVIISPLPRLLNRNSALQSSMIFTSNETFSSEIDYGLLNSVYNSELRHKEERIENALALNGIENSVVAISAGVSQDNLQEIYLISIDIKNAVISFKETNINTNDFIIEIVRSMIDVKEEQIIIYGG